MSEQDIPHEIVDDDGAAGTGMLLQGQALPIGCISCRSTIARSSPARCCRSWSTPSTGRRPSPRWPRPSTTAWRCSTWTTRRRAPRSSIIESLPEHGTVVRIHRASKQDDTLQFVAQGLARVRIRHWLSRTPPYLVEVD